MSNNRKILSIVLALILALSVIPTMPLSVSAEETGYTAPEGFTPEPNKIYFDVNGTGWEMGAKDKVAFYIYGGDFGTEANPTTPVGWGTKKPIGTATTGVSGMYEIDPAAKLGYTFTEGVQYKIIFVHTSVNSWKEQTYDLYFTTDCFGHVAYCDGTTTENPVDSSKNALTAYWYGIDPAVCGPVLQITSIGNVVGTCPEKGKTPASVFSDFLSVVNTDIGRTGLENARKFVVNNGIKTEQQLIDDIGTALNLTIEQVETAAKETGVEIAWSAKMSTMEGHIPLVPTDPDLFDYEIENDQAIITGYHGTSPNVVIPDTINGYPVTEIGYQIVQCADEDSKEGCLDKSHYPDWEEDKLLPNATSWHCTHLVSAFDNSGVQTVTLPDTVKTIRAFAFKDCTALQTIELSSELESIDEFAFYGCSALTDITFPEGLKAIGNQSFENCTALTSIHIPASVTDIGRKASDKDELYKHFEDYVTYRVNEEWGNIYPVYKTIACNSFRGCTALQSITVAEGNPVYDSRDNCNAIIRTKDNTLVFGSSCSTIPNTITMVGYFAFSGCTDLTSIELPSSVTEIDECAFCGCTNLTTFAFPSSVSEIGRYAFSDCTGLASVTFSDTAVGLGYRAFEDCTALTEITLPDYSTIGGSAFSGCTGLKRAVIPEQVTGLSSSCLGVYIIDYNLVNDKYWETVYRKVDTMDLTIYGYYGTEVEEYAAKYDIPFRMIAPATSDEVIVDAPEGKTYSVVSKATPDEATPDTQKLPEGSVVLSAYDITLRDIKDETPVQPDAPVTVRIRCDKPDAHVFRRETDGTLTDMKARYEDGYLVFETDHFSVYLVVQLSENTDALLGDADGDGEITVNDATFIQRYLVGSDRGIDPAVIERNCDVDGDGKVNVIDVTLIQRKLAGLPVRYPIGEAL